ncbi:MULTISPECIES: alpha/beta fold hydrolase [unclassified Kribbella]|uniref:alpha/beta fold hydrolase n=1 Tax=unclassified Kribbella TaxID=2644121 RepID=UPI003019EBCD
MELRIAVGGGEVWAEHVAGPGVPVVLLHPGVGDSRVWDPVMPRLVERHRVVRYDARGYGRSALPTSEFSLVEDLLSVLDQLGLEQVVLVGCSMGGDTALSLALNDPARVRALVLLCPGVSGFPMPDEPELDQADYLRKDPPVYDRLQEIQVPSVVMVGDKDRPIMAAVAGAAAARIPGCEFIWLPGADHLPSLRSPDQVAETILRYAV